MSIISVINSSSKTKKGIIMMFVFVHRIYESVEFRTGSSLNVIIGPNGTGKSAIVCAICLGLAGTTSWLGRASSPADYIRYGTNRGIIELELCVFHCVAISHQILMFLILVN